MSQNNYYSIRSTIELMFTNSKIRDISYDSFLPELKNTRTKRSKTDMEKKNNSLIFYIESTDITAFRGGISDIIALGKIIENSLKLCE